MTDTAPVRAGIVVTGTEVLTGRVTDRNGPWLAERLLELGVELTSTIVVGDRPSDMTGALRFLADQGCALILTSGGLGPTPDDLTAQMAADFQGREMVLDEALEQRIDAIVQPMLARWPNIDKAAVDAATRKQAFVPVGADVIEPAGTAPGLVIPPPDGTGGPTIVVLPGPPRELQGMWEEAVGKPAFRAAIEGAADYRQETLRLFVLPESEIAETLRLAPDRGVALDDLEITTCQRSAELEIVTRFEPPAAAAYAALVELVRERHGQVLFSEDGSSIDDQVADLLLSQDASIAVAESCTGGLLGARLISRAGSSRYVAGGVIAYSNPAKVELAGVSQEILDTVGAVSGEAAEALAEGARTRLATTVGVGITGIAGPGGGTEDKPVGTVWLSVTHEDGRALTRRIKMPGSRTEVRDRTVMVALHLLRRVLRGEDDAGLPTRAT